MQLNIIIIIYTDPDGSESSDVEVLDSSDVCGELSSSSSCSTGEEESGNAGEAIEVTHRREPMQPAHY